ncbi:MULTISPECIES: PLP-dependent aminotransferase family protein [unclassified Bacillus (in: firmicutes)]|uniref:MocR-like pyridoxine biosynthesis transcription factor PdxR n=1 Tax=unclassified Bacillus (in: firmicutes) TaxID=185979 RepID=UPI0008E1C60F|nr:MULTISPECIES: PLP-dependent aminotransferase family protein [unclassified Bacillus (in: firmicutes)]SFI03921.1 GntR family transcriptional regulator / MocR family aminotransferase [Bacillus sp. 71mf]SFS80602.1 GntR family transcriptional regulator / MocR family aminotransferase [Bacillus sp. 103mf]
MELTIPLDSKSKIPLYIQIYNYMKKEILQGKIEFGSRLPSHRSLSLQLNVSRNTVEYAYQQLIAEGYVESKHRRGLFVASIDYNMIRTTNNKNIVNRKKSVQENFRFDFSHGSIDTSSFPLSTWKKITNNCLLEYENDLFTKEDPQGEWQLRSEISRYLYQARGVESTPEHIVIGAGTQPLLWLLLQLLGYENNYAMENPGFHRVRAVMQSCGLHIRPISLDEKGIHISSLYESGANVVYVTPSHQFPYGMIMTLSRRMELLKWANDNNGYIIEDDYDGEFRYTGKPIPSLQGLDTNGRVIYMGTFSKSFLPSFRMSYMVLPQTLLANYQHDGTIFKQTVSKIQQLTFATFMKEGYWERHLNRIRTVYKKKHHFLVHTIQKEMGPLVDIIGSDSGLHIVLHVHNGMNEQELINKAAEQSVKVYPLSPYDMVNNLQKKSYVLMGFGGISIADIPCAIQLLKKAWF